jgi:uncharacterized membrane protein YbhN (UPF0104 family)
MQSTLLKIFQRVLPWLVALGLFAWMFHRIPPAPLLQALERAPLIPFALYSIVYFLIVGALDTWTLQRVITQFEGPIRMGEIWPSRCVSYLFALVNYNAGQAALAGYIKKIKGFSFFKTLGNVFFITVTDLYLIITFAFIASFFVDISLQGSPLTRWIQTAGYVAFAALFLHLAFWHRWFTKLLPVKMHSKMHFAFGDWVRGRHLFSAFHQAKLLDYLKVALYRLPLHLIFIANMWVVVRLFGAAIGWKDVFGTVPIIFLFGALPISPGGLGVSQVATVELLKDKITSPHFATGSMGAEETLFALSLAWLGVNYLIKALVGLYYFRKYPIRLK